MATHRCLLRVQRPDSGFWKPGDLVDYDGPPNWKFEPLDPAAREAWERDTADPERLRVELRRTGCLDEGAVPPGMVLSKLRQHPPSGWQGY